MLQKLPLIKIIGTLGGLDLEILTHTMFYQFPSYSFIHEKILRCPSWKVTFLLSEHTQKFIIAGITKPKIII